MRLIIADTGPINYLVLIGNIDLLPLLFEGDLAIRCASRIDGPGRSAVGAELDRQSPDLA